MTRFRRPTGFRSLCTALIAAIAIAVTASACDNNDDQTPIGPGTTPTITGVLPTPLVVHPVAQRLTISGTNFLPNLTLLVTPPNNGSVQAISGSSIQDLQASSFQADVVLDTPGTYGLVVRNSSGNTSATFPVQVQSGSPTGTPNIASITPVSVTHGTDPVLVTLNGTNFAEGLNVVVTRPSGGPQVITSGFNVVTATQVQFMFVLDTVGTYAFSVTNPDAQASNAVVITVT
jgi:hypothetical protein